MGTVVSFRSHALAASAPFVSAPRSANTRSIALPAAPRSGGPSVSQRWIVDWSTPKRAPKASWLSPRSVRADLIRAGVTFIGPLCIAHSESQCQTHTTTLHSALMGSPEERLQRARVLAGYEDAAAGARALGVPYATYAGHENGSRGFKGQAERYAAFFQVDLTWLLTGRGQARPESLQGRILALSPEGQRTVRDMIELLEDREAARRKTG